MARYDHRLWAGLHLYNTETIVINNSFFWQVLKEREEAAFVLTDDFLENGNEQVLLLPPNLTISNSKGFFDMIKWCDIS